MLLRFALEWMLGKFAAKMKDEEGQGLVEYALILVLVSIACILGLQALVGAEGGGGIMGALYAVADELTPTPGTGGTGTP